MSQVYLQFGGKDFHGSGCACGECNENGHAYEVKAYKIPDNITIENEDDLFDFLHSSESDETFYAPSEEAAKENALQWLTKNNHEFHQGE